jgi:hypothetical protein
LPAHANLREALVQVTVADDHPTEAFRQIEGHIARARSAGVLESQFWWAIAAARVLIKLERHADATFHAASAAAVLRSLPATGAQRLWLKLAQLDAHAGSAGRATLLPQVSALRLQAESLGETRLACEAISLEIWLLVDMRNDDEAWLAAEAMERCGQTLNWPEQKASAQIVFAQL